ncbi:MAG: hypothetical protein QNK37_26935, partial [Acidobacteriota bacterium]|nr:hypothetical protein [Acidobacteriota bacterium]
LGITNFFSPKTPGSRIGRAPITRHGEHRQNKLLTQSRQKTSVYDFPVAACMPEIDPRGP